MNGGGRDSKRGWADGGVEVQEGQHRSEVSMKIF